MIAHSLPRFLLLLCALFLAIISPTVLSLAKASDNLLSSLFRHHTSVMMFIDPANGAIVDANLAATEFYG